MAAIVASAVALLLLAATAVMFRKEPDRVTRIASAAGFAAGFVMALAAALVFGVSGGNAVALALLGGSVLAFALLGQMRFIRGLLTRGR